jgi:uncharacterized protein (UPF0332 family)
MTSGFNWLLYLDVADHLLTQSGEEFFRSATSRAYYGVFCSIRDLLEDSRGRPFPRGRNIHPEVIKALKNGSSSDFVQMGIDLDRLRRERNRADYSTNGSFDLARGRKCMWWAREIQNRLSDIRG